MSKQDELYVAKKLLIPKDVFFSEIDRLVAQVDSLRNLNSEDSKFKAWKQAVTALLNHALGEKSQQAYDFGWISFSPSVYSDDDLNDVWGGVATNRECLVFAHGLDEARDRLLAIRDEVQKYFENTNQDVQPMTASRRDGGNRVFVVHGHDTELLLKVKEFLRKFHLEPVVLREQPNQGRTIIEKFEHYADVGYAIALLTADDEVVENGAPGSKEFRARQNVVLELGYFMGALGRSRVAVICGRNVSKPGDIDGMVYSGTEADESWQFAISKELKAAGYEIDMNLLV